MMIDIDVLSIFVLSTSPDKEEVLCKPYCTGSQSGGETGHKLNGMLSAHVSHAPRPGSLWQRLFSSWQRDWPLVAGVPHHNRAARSISPMHCGIRLRRLATNSR